MMSLADAAAALAGDPRPVLALDTCVLLDVIRAGVRGQSDRIAECRRLSEVVVTAPESMQLVVTSLVVLEWSQNKDEVGNEAAEWLTETDRRILEIHKTWDGVGSPLPDPAPTYFDPGLVAALISLGESLILAAIVLEEDNACVMRALDRVKQKQRPSHKREIKDSIHLEHYLELSRQLHVNRYAHLTFFVSSNSSDFWTDRNTPSQPHVDLRADLSAAGLTFYGQLDFALRHLGMIPGVAPPAAGGP
jgi:hypothetical protein